MRYEELDEKCREAVDKAVTRLCCAEDREAELDLLRQHLQSEMDDEGYSAVGADILAIVKARAAGMPQHGRA